MSEAGSGAVPVRGWRRVGPAALVFLAACAVHLAIVFGLQWLVPYALGTESYALLWPGIVGTLAFQPISSVLGPRFGVGWILADVALYGALATWGLLRLRDARARRPAGPARTHRTGADPLTGRR